MGVVEVATPVGEDNGQGAGDEGDDPQPRLGVAAVQQAEQGGKQQQTEEDVNVPEKSKFDSQWLGLALELDKEIDF